MNKVALTFFLLFSMTYTLLAQHTSISGKVINADTGLPIPYATVGIPGKSLGTVANDKGEFAFTVPADKASSGDKIIVSCIGFETEELAISTLDKGLREVKLKPQIVDLKEVAVKPEKPKRRILGKNERHRLVGSNFFTIYEQVDDALGKERGMILNLNKDCFCNDFNFYIKTNYFSLVKFRLNVYDVKNGLPHDLLLKDDIIFDVKDQETGWVKVDLSKYNIFLEGTDKVAVTLQWIESKQARQRNFFTIPTSYPSIGHTIVYRNKSQDAWKTFNGNLSMYFTADCYNRY